MKKIIIFILIVFLLVGIASAAMPTYTHKYMWQKSVESPINSDLYKDCIAFPSLCYTGNVLTDVSVIFYYTQSGKYEATHDPVFCRNLLEDARTPQERACAIGSCTHQPQDIPFHNILVPFTITHSGFTNYIIHVFAEQKVDNYFQKNYPSIGQEALNWMSDYEECSPLFKKVMLRDQRYSDLTESELNDVFDKFISEIQSSQTGYDTAFENKGFFVNIKTIPFAFLAGYCLFMLFFTFVTLLLIIKVFRRQAKFRHYFAILFFGFVAVIMIIIFVANLQGSAFATFVKIIKPVSNLVPIGDTPMSYAEQAIDNTRQVLYSETWLTDTEASGFTALENADRKVMLFDYIIIVVILAVLLFWVRYLFKKNKIKSDFRL